MGKGGRARAQAGPSPPRRRRRPLALQVLEPERAPLLFNLVFGEGVINDATTIALLRTVQALGPEPRMSVSTVVGMLASFASLFAFSLALGVAVGLGASLLLKRTGVHGVPQARAGCGHGRWVAGQARPPHRARPPAHPPPAPQAVGLVGMASYLAYLVGDVLGLSGIVSLFCCAVALSHYGLPNIRRGVGPLSLCSPPTDARDLQGA